ncbi:MAG: hypothetical protein L3J74_04440 [Bacteroidales bacterium]|nr:hypothetical protein [Bacteroidales bacterium]
MKKLKYFILFFTIILFVNCEKKRTEPYDMDSRLPTFNALINSYNFEAERITIGKPNDRSHIFVAGIDSLYLLSIGFPMNCGEKTFELPSSDPNFFMLFNNIEGKKGKLVITKYDINLVEAEFEFETDKDTIINIKKGTFSIIYGVD